MFEVRCSKCGVGRKDSHRDGEPIPCPNCGAITVNFQHLIEERVEVSDDLLMQLKRNDELIASQSTGSDGRSSSAAPPSPGELEIQVRGSPYQGEDNTLWTCRLLIRKWNEDGEDWDDPKLVSDDPKMVSDDPKLVLDQKCVDCLSASNSGSEKARIQVTRANSDSEFWQKLSKEKFNSQRVGTRDIADQVKKTIEKKKRKIPQEVRAGIHLALDARLTHGHEFAFPDVVECFRKRHGTWVDACGFRSVWLVGPSLDLVQRLDSESACESDRPR